MKFRKDFVTNSSSSSYICEICGRSECGMDIGLRDVEMVECENGHVFCQDEMLEVARELLLKCFEEEFDSEVFEENKNSSNDELLQMMLDDYTLSDFRYNVPEDFCPICQFIEYSERDMADYLLSKYGVSRESVFEEVKKFNKRRKKLYDGEYITHVCKLYDLNPISIVAGWKDEFGSYKKFKKNIINQTKKY